MKYKFMQVKLEYRWCFLCFPGITVWSKLKTGRIPQGNELFEIINSQLDSRTPKNSQSGRLSEEKNFEDEKPNVNTQSSEGDFQEFDTDSREEL